MAPHALVGAEPGGALDRWPTGMGFDRFYGIIGAEASH